MLISSARRRKVSGQRRALLPTVVYGIAVWLAFPTVAAYQDMVSLVAGQQAENRWAAVVEAAVAGSVHKAEMPFSSTSEQLGVLSGAGVQAHTVGTVAFRTTKGDRLPGSDEKGINRREKKSRLVKTLPMAPPRLFNAGSIFKQTSLLMEPAPMGEKLMAFGRPDIKGREVAIASSFHLRHNKARDRLPTAIAELITNDEPDILASAYAPREPDYARASPFASILRDENDGRFIPPVAPDDHEWGRRPLPPHVFSDKEQQCLAAGIYFEARGEPVRGQAAVAQVILNRVRNPAYPDTICGVVYQNENWRNRCQFSFACDGIRDRVRSPEHFRTAKEVGFAVTAGKIWLEEVGTATHYHATYVQPRWARAMERKKKIGQHIFYRTYGGGWN
ncbi:cell wall hydrolase [Chelativorans sp. Marseille-P2723]|uniref:cell wall hydrolase n=1 Tax=Chelativorans sp. Marseille-P2723 TaxID=2709133 RepID=UPI001FEEEC67|nr:cell wall hydrolase [Chelativorans sp. Marseille-P2723]